MFWGLVKSLFSSSKPPVAAAGVRELLERAGEHRDHGRLAEAIKAFEQVLALDPYNSFAMNDLAACFVTLGRDLEARQLYEKAALMDDTFVPALVNYAASLSESFQSAQALELLENARRLMPDAGYIDSAMARIKTSWGEAEQGRELFLSAWLKEFDDNRFAENFLFNSCSAESVSAERLYAEHAFWAETLLDIGKAPIRTKAERREGRVRIGYLSPDLRQHSVRYFFRPLLEAHDRERFEIFAYYEFGVVDAQTELIRSKCDHFRHIPGVVNAEFERIILDDDLDILVELAGHTSVNRTGLLRRRLARIQVTALGYPPTTGLSEMDFKVVDKHSAPPGTEQYYSERLLRLPNTFWCFNPLEETPNPAPPPCLKKGFVTFGCYGNAGKISSTILACWQQIMARVPDSQVVIKSLSFQDESSRESFAARMEAAGIDLNRVQLVLPDPPEALYGAYADIDLILDTYPFNGGTTTAFALWMGVPLVTLQGEVLLSRMGSSMLHELGLSELIAEEPQDYVERAVALANDHEQLAAIRASMRGKLLSSPLGNGELYARQFETACLEALNEGVASVPGSDDKPCLPEQVLVERALAVMRSGNYEAVTRIVRYCLKRYPMSLGAHLLWARLRERKGEVRQAYEDLQQACQAMESPLDAQVLIYLMRFQLLLGLNEDVLSTMSAHSLSASESEWYAVPLAVYQSAARARLGQHREITAEAGRHFLSILVHCDSDEKFARISEGVVSALPPQSYELLRGSSATRAKSYKELLGLARSDVIVLLHEDVELITHDFHREVSCAIDQFDVVGAAGVKQLCSPLWFDVDEGAPCGALVLPVQGNAVQLDLCVYSAKRYSSNLQALEGALIVARRSVFDAVPIDPQVGDVACLAELEWTYRAALAGFNLAAVPGLGVLRRVVDVPQDDAWRQSALEFSGRYEGLRAAKARCIPDGVALPLLNGKDAVLTLRSLYGETSAS